MQEHSLRREIIATQLGKSITDHMGISLVERLQRETGASIAFIMRAYVIAESIYDMQDLWHEIEALDFKININVQHRMMLQIYLLIRRATRWFLRNYKPELEIEKTIDEFKKPIHELMNQLPNLLTATDLEDLQKEVNFYLEQGVPTSLAFKIASCNTLFTSLDIVHASRKHNIAVEDIAETYYSLGTHLELNWLREQINQYTMETQWEELARASYRDDLDRVQRKLSVSVIMSKSKKANGKSIEERIHVWLDQKALLLTRWQNLISEIKSSTAVSFITYSVLLRELFDFAQAGR
jgi:glutamate dehydrogenase